MSYSANTIAKLLASLASPIAVPVQPLADSNSVIRRRRRIHWAGSDGV